MGCVQKKKSQDSAQPIFMNLQIINPRFYSGRELDSANLPNNARLDFQTLFKQNLIEELIINRETQKAFSRSCLKNKQKALSPVVKIMKKHKNTNQRKTCKGVSESVNEQPRCMIIKRRSLSDVNS